MKVIQFADYGDVDVLHEADAPLPVPGPGEIRIRVAAVAVNPADPKWRRGMFRSFAPVPFPHVLGYDIAGTVDALGDGVAGVRIGARVFAMLDAMRKGGYAEFAVLPAAAAVPIPDGIDFATAAALPTAGLTGVQMAEEHARLSPGQSVLITGAVGSVGRFALYAARQAGARIVAAVRASQAAEAASLGAESVIVLGEDWAGPPFDRMIDTVGGADVARLCRHIAPGGAIYTAATIPIDEVGLAIKPVFVMVHADPSRLARLAAAVAPGDLRVPVARRLPLSAAREAHRLVEQGGAGGKIVLEP